MSGYSPPDKTKLPQILLMENVPQVIGKKNIKDFAEWIAFLDTLGYTSKWAVLNATNFNVPQNRERCFMVSWLGDHSYFFPQGEGCKQQLKDRLEKSVEEKFYLSDRAVKYVSNSTPPRVSKAVRASGRQSYDRHSWDIVVELRQDGGEGIDGGDNTNGKGLQRVWQSGADRCYRDTAEEVIESADGTIIGRSSSFSPSPLKGLSRTIDTEGKNAVVEQFIVYDDYNGRIKADQSCIGTLTTNCGATAEKNGVKIIEKVWQKKS